MGSLIDIRRRIKSTKNTQQITNAMKMVSASRLRRASERAVNARSYAEGIFEVHRSILARMGEPTGPLYEEREGKTLLVVFAGDKGLCGPFNSNIFKRTFALFEAEGMQEFTILPVGKKAIGQFNKMSVTTLKGYDGIFRNVTVAAGEELADRLMKLYAEGGYSRVMLLYNKFKNVLVQEVTLTQVLPLVPEAEVELGGAEHLAEPSLEAILEELSPRVVMTGVFQALLESCASEHAARMTAMEAATKNASEMIDKLTLEMNKARQAAITKELIEVVSGAAAL
jgi:F-type H+-transporting ATPase subunit gamma